MIFEYIKYIYNELNLAFGISMCLMIGTIILNVLYFNIETLNKKLDITAILLSNALLLTSIVGFLISSFNDYKKSKKNIK